MLVRIGRAAHGLDPAVRFEDLPTFVADDLTFNGLPMTGRQCRGLLEDDVRGIPDLLLDFALQLHHAVGIGVGYDSCRRAGQA